MRCLSGALALFCASASACSGQLPDEPAAIGPQIDQRTSALVEVPITLQYDNFSDVSMLQLNGSAVQSGASLRLTDNVSTAQAASVFYRQPLSLENHASFSTYFRIHVTDGGGISNEADGLVFVLQSVSPSALGTSGLGIGYSGMQQSFAVEFDDFQNANLGDLDAQHVGTHLNGDMSTHLAYATSPSAWDDGEHFVFIDYDGTTHQLEVRVSQNDPHRPSVPLLTQSIDLLAALGDVPLYAGFSSSTDAAWAQHWVDAWYFQDNLAPFNIVGNTYTQAPRTVTLGAATAPGDHSAHITVVVLDADGTGRANWPVTMTTDQGALSEGNFTTDSQGQAQVTLQAGAQDATAHVLATASGGASAALALSLRANPVIETSVSGTGAVSPAGTVLVAYGASQNFALEPGKHSRLKRLIIDGQPVDPAASYAFNGVTGSHTLAATFGDSTLQVGLSCDATGDQPGSGAACLAALIWIYAAMRATGARRLPVSGSCTS